MTKTILLVEDVSVIALCESSLLQGAGYNVIHVNSGEDAVCTDRERGPAIDLILMDIELGEGITGIDAASEIMECSAIPIIFLSSHEKFEVELMVRKLGYAGYVFKHSGPDLIFDLIRETLYFAGAGNNAYGAND